MARLITLPHKWQPRPYQIPFMAAMDGGIKRAILVWHRRSGKDAACGNYISKRAHERVANYFYLFPTQRQAKTAFWENIGKDGRRFLDQAFPKELREATRNDEMFIRFKNGSSLKVTGADNFDSLVGSNPAGIVFSEFAITSPLTWRYMQPILAENGGWAIFNSTPRGRNHLFELYRDNKDNPEWHTEIRGWKDTGAITQAVIDADIKAGMPEEIAEQEYNCSFNAQNVGVVYRRQLDMLRAQGRITTVAYNRSFPVETATDIGHRDATSTWFYQDIAGERRFIDFWEARGSDLPSWAQMIHSKGYAYSRHIGPHDLEHRDWAAGKPADLARNFGINFVVAPKMSVEHGIGAARVMLARCRFDAERCADGLARLEAYEFKWDEIKRIFGSEPIHNWASHAADALRYAAVVPEELMLTPDWAKPFVQPQAPQPSWMGHNGEPPLVVDPHLLQPEYNPLAHWTQ